MHHCHTAKVPTLNPYGKDLKLAKLDFAAIEENDSDGDDAANLSEIKALTLPGDPKDKPVAADSTSAPPADSSAAPPDSTAKPDSTGGSER